MKRLIVSVFLVLSAIGLFAQQAKRVYITLDVSGSMTGDKYILANYTTQMIVTLCDDDDEVYLIVYGKEKCLSKERDPLRPIQKPMEKIRFGLPLSTISQFEDIQGFNDVYKPSASKQDWLFIIGDGYWSTEADEYSKDCKKFQNTVKNGDLNVCYLQTCSTLSEHSDFTIFVESIGVIDIGKSDTNPKTIMKECDHFAKKILGFSDVALNTNKVGKQCLSIKAEMPISEFILVYQDKVAPNRLPNVDGVSSDGKALKVKLKGTPTTIPVQGGFVMELSGNVWRVRSDSPIPANTEIEVCFDKSIDLGNVSIYPIVENVEFGCIGFTPENSKLKQLNSNTFSICRDENSAKIRVELSEESKTNLPEELLKKTVVVVKANNKEYKAKYKEGGFECEIDLQDEETQYYAECDCPGYFKRVTPIVTIVKGDCEPVKPKEMSVTERPTLELPSTTFETLKNDPIKGTLHEIGNESNTLDPSKFDIDVEVENPYLFEKPEVSFEGDVIVLDLHPKGGWCECLFPDDVNIKLISTPKEGAFADEGKQFSQTVHPIHFKLEKSRGWFSRCLWVLLTMAGLLLLMFYLLALLKKNRFKKSARIKNTYMEMKGSITRETPLQNGYRLRDRKSIKAWFDRWFVPFRDERRTLSWQTPPTGYITFVAARSKETVNFTKGSFKKDRMKMGQYGPTKDERAYVEMEDPIKIYHERKYEGRLEYDSSSKDDENWYRLIVEVLFGLSVAAFVVLLILLIRSLF